MRRESQKPLRKMAIIGNPTTPPPPLRRRHVEGEERLEARLVRHELVEGARRRRDGVVDPGALDERRREGIHDAIERARAVAEEEGLVGGGGRRRRRRSSRSCRRRRWRGAAEVRLERAELGAHEVDEFVGRVPAVALVVQDLDALGADAARDEPPQHRRGDVAEEQRYGVPLELGLVDPPHGEQRPVDRLLEHDAEGRRDRALLVGEPRVEVAADAPRLERLDDELAVAERLLEVRPAAHEGHFALRGAAHEVRLVRHVRVRHARELEEREQLEARRTHVGIVVERPRRVDLEDGGPPRLVGGRRCCRPRARALLGLLLVPAEHE
mmetsp:Transcript_729/g.2901  ORF Transcript_729/g.2901 Transcript_729/m.2901 type:complete len:326 (-) Transcript_729:135-1112(-)